jgi:hypothetical protein
LLAQNAETGAARHPHLRRFTSSTSAGTEWLVGHYLFER